MAEIVVGLLGPVIELVKCIAAPIKRQCIYLCCFNSNAKSLHKEAKKLEDERVGLQMEVDSAINNAHMIDAKVETWLKEVNEIQQKMSGLETEITNVQGSSCLYVKFRYSASRRAVKIAEAMKQKREDRRDIPTISHRPPPASMVPDILEGPTSEFESREKIEEYMMTILKDENVKIMGMCGMGGVGKTTLADKIKDRVRKENVFGESVMVVVSQPADKLKIQGELAENLGLEFKEKSLSGRAERLRSRLRGGKRILIVLDDIWEYLDLKELGIPCQSGCTILLTSRNRGVLARMDAQSICVVETLTKSEAWSLFKEKVGTCADYNLAQEIANECKGLPLALVSVAGALKDEKNISVWKDALQQLRSSNPEDLSDVLQHVYIPIKLSYDYLSSQNAKSLFLLCCLFPEDFNIPLRDLTACAIGLRMFEEVGNLEQVANKTCLLVKMLISRFLLLEGWDEDSARMHDVVRDVAIFIASKEKRLIKCGYNSTWISSFVGGERIQLSKGLNFPNLRLLLIEDSGDEKFENSGISFEGMEELRVLSIGSYFSLTLTLATKNLGTLILENCESLKTISVVGELLNLEVLICRKCNVIEEFPYETLKCLRLLHISRCQALKKIGSARAISCLDKKDSGHQSRHIAKLESLQLLNLPNLRVFYQGIESIEFPLLTKLEIVGCYELEGLVSSYEDIRMDDDHSLHSLCKQEVSLGNIMRKVRVEGIRNWNKVFRCSQIPVGAVSHLEVLRIEYCDDIKSLFSFSMAQNLETLKVLIVENCKKMEKVIEEEGEECSSTLVFPHLQQLQLVCLPKLKTFCNSALGLPQLVQLLVYNCSEMGGGFNLGSNLESLETLNIEYCGMMEQVLLWRKEEKIIDNHCPRISFQKLQLVMLYGLTRLTSLYKGVESIDFCLPTQMDIRDCPNLKTLVSSNKEQYPSSFSIWDQIPIASFTRLENLELGGHDGISSLFPYSVADALSNLEFLGIDHCKNMVKVIEGEGEGEYSNDQTTPLFPHLKDLSLFELPELKIFCEWRCALELPSLEKMSIDSGCPKLERFSLGSLTTPNLKTIQIEGDIIAGADLNHVLHQRFITTEKTISREGEEDSKEEE